MILELGGQNPLAPLLEVQKHQAQYQPSQPHSVNSLVSMAAAS